MKAKPKVDEVYYYISEEDFMRSVIKIASDCGWFVYHTPDSRRSQAGFPDLTLVSRTGDIIFTELKSQKGRIRKEQQEWLDRLRENGHIDVYLWRPSDLQDIINRLVGGSNLEHPFESVRAANEKLMGHSKE
tara:strand:+ start:155 stop:550 length:396 start_codon:yes stop_codon:yes gene_type:complete